MQKFTLLVCFLVVGASLFGQNLKLPVEKIDLKDEILKRDFGKLNLENKKSTYQGRQTVQACDNDTIQYTRIKRTSVIALTIVGKGQGTVGEGLGQWFEGPQPIAIHGVEFYGRAKNATPATVNVRIYSALNDSTPGNLLGTTSTVLNNTALSLSALRRNVNFSTPIMTNGPYLVVVEGEPNSSDTIQLVTTGDGDGFGEGLSKVRVTSGVNTFWGDVGNVYGLDADFYTFPIVSYSISSKFSVSSDLKDGTPVIFTNQSSPIFFSRFYNFYVLADTTEESFYWNFGENTSFGPAIDTTYTYNTPGNKTVTLNAEMLGYRNVFYTNQTTCNLDTIAVIVIQDKSLPVTLSGFGGERQGSNNILKWTTATEANNKGFELERSIDGVNFSSLAFVQTKSNGGNSSLSHNYLYTDSKPFKGNGYYRLKQVDKDGRFNYSSVVLIKGGLSGKVQLSSVYPNPARSIINVVLNTSAKTTVNFVVTDLAGKTIMQQSSEMKAGDNTVPINIGKLAAGSYIVKAICETGCELALSRFVKQ